MTVGADTKKPTDKKKPKDNTPVIPGIPDLNDLLSQAVGATSTTSSSGLENLKLYFRDNKGKEQPMTVGQFANLYSQAFTDTKNPYHKQALDIVSAWRGLGVFGKSASLLPDDVRTGFKKIAVNAANAYNNGKGPKSDAFSLYSNALQVLAKYQQVSDRQQRNDIRQFSAQESQMMAFNAFKEAFGRAPSNKEVKAYQSALTAASNAAPTVTSSKQVNGKTVVTTTGGFDFKTWSAGYMSALLPKEKNQADLSGSAGQIQDLINSWADAYGVSLNPVDQLVKIRDYMARNADASEIKTDLQQQFSGMAKLKYGEGMAQAIDNGATVAEVVKPYLAKYAQLMEIAPDSLNLSDIADKVVLKEPNGGSRLLTENEFDSVVRQDPKWKQTLNAKQEAFDLGQSVLKTFGLVK